MNDAGETHPLAAPAASLVAWFQVGVYPVSGDRSLPVQPFLCCIDEAAARIGTLTLRTVQLVLPVQCLDASSRPFSPSLMTASWFNNGDPRARTPVRVTLDSGRAPSILAAAPGIREQLSQLHQETFVCEGHSLTDHDPLAARPPLVDDFWNGPPRHRATLYGTLTEWSLDALGWLAGYLADLSAEQGVTTPLLLTASR